MYLFFLCELISLSFIWLLRRRFIAPLIILLIGLASVAWASIAISNEIGETTSHDTQRVPYRKAFQVFQEEGCRKIVDSRNNRVQLSRPDKSTFQMDGDSWAIKCVRWAEVEVPIVEAEVPITEEPTVSVQISWSPPEFREDGRALALYEIASYEIYVYDDKGELTVFTAEGASTETIFQLTAGTYQIAMLAVDADGLRSDMTASISTTIVTPS